MNSKKAYTSLLKAAVVTFGIAVFAALLWFPQTEGRNVNSDPISLYFNDPFLAYVYLGSIPFFIGIYQAFKFLNLIDQRKSFSQNAVNALHIIRNCALTIIAFLIGAIIFIFFTSRSTNDDGAGAIVIGLFLTVISVIVAVSTAMIEKVVVNKVGKVRK